MAAGIAGTAAGRAGAAGNCNSGKVGICVAVSSVFIGDTLAFILAFVGGVTGSVTFVGNAVRHRFFVICWSSQLIVPGERGKNATGVGSIVFMTPAVAFVAAAVAAIIIVVMTSFVDVVC